MTNGKKCDNCNYCLHDFVLNDKNVAECKYCYIQCKHSDSDQEYRYDTDSHWTVNVCRVCQFEFKTDWAKVPHEFGDSGVTCVECFYNSNSSPEDPSTESGPGTTCECFDIEFSHFKIVDGEWHARMGKCKSCGALSELVNERHNVGSDATCADCGYDPANNIETETDSSTIPTPEKSDPDTKLELNPFLIIPAAAVLGLIIIVIVFVAQRKRK